MYDGVSSLDRLNGVTHDTRRRPQQITEKCHLQTERLSALEGIEQASMSAVRLGSTKPIADRQFSSQRRFNKRVPKVTVGARSRRSD
jgi:hypothetical protein